ncbi:MAG: 30S ribosome-binding factor RbfA [Eubacteriales bacterium]
MSNNRIQRINETIRQEVSCLIRFNLKDPRVNNDLLSVLKVDTTGDLRYAKVYVSVFDKPEKKQEAIDILNKAAGFFRKNIGKKLQTHYTPEIIFTLDDSIEYGVHIDHILKKINTPNQKDHDDE